ncbi:hypothetical protein FHL15_007326 [Xylaria flabelliformis]|uniref:Uncharacterized protein n=1 Tax=Xylaria flabelliformis TaxID=2512241 RepID=A0A553HV14_9PEZI|nr:hypothetical protein FHL15_007326 [Xylaria flabelliformis]
MYISGINGRGVSQGTRSELAGTEQQQQVFPVSHVTTHTSNEPIQNSDHHLFTWILKAISIVPLSDNAPSSSAVSPLPASSGSLGKRSADPNTLTSIVAGVLVTAFIIFAGVFLCVYRRSIRFRKQARKSRRHRHGRRASGTSKISQGSEAVGGGGGGGDGGVDDGAAAADAPA